jgi:hypothetical protein
VAAVTEVDGTIHTAIVNGGHPEQQIDLARDALATLID